MHVYVVVVTYVGPRVSVYASGKSQVPMLQLLYSTWVTCLQVETAGMLCECIYIEHCEFQLSY